MTTNVQIVVVVAIFGIRNWINGDWTCCNQSHKYFQTIFCCCCFGYLCNRSMWSVYSTWINCNTIQIRRCLVDGNVCTCGILTASLFGFCKSNQIKQTRHRQKHLKIFVIVVHRFDATYLPSRLDPYSFTIYTRAADFFPLHKSRRNARVTWFRVLLFYRFMIQAEIFLSENPIWLECWLDVLFSF